MNQTSPEYCEEVQVCSLKELIVVPAYVKGKLVISMALEHKSLTGLCAKVLNTRHSSQNHFCIAASEIMTRNPSVNGIHSNLLQ